MRKVLSLLVCVGLIGVGCSRQPTAPAPSGSFGPDTPPVPAEVQRLLDLHAVDPDLLLPDVESPGSHVPTLTDTSYDVYAVTFLWGTFFPPTATVAPPPSDWSGKLSINAEAFIRLHTVIDFEPGQDSVFEEDHPTVAVWRSITENDFDGLSFLIFVKRGIEYFAAPTLLYETAPIRLEFLLERLTQLDLFFPVGPWSGVAVHARELRPNHCPHGLLGGRWIKENNTGSEGHFEGIWADALGRPIGPVAGRFWTTEDGERLLEGVVSGGTTTQVIIYLEGIWAYDDYRMCPLCGGGHGKFIGRFKMADGDGGGKFGGEFGDWSLPPDDLIMPFAGRWRFDCPNDATDLVDPGSN
jgi:hypothetical protein